MTGQARHQSGAEIKPNTKDLIGVIQNVAKLKRPKQRRMAVVEGFRVAPTKLPKSE